MNMHFDDHGKFYTMVISKEAVAVIIQTIDHRISGQIHIRPGERLKDEINREDPFFAVTDATILDENGAPLYRSEFLAINRQQIIWLLPEDQLITDQ